jgi:cytochrome c oxidase subunit IV
MANAASHGHEAHAHEASMTKKSIWNVFWVLFGITTLEFIIALVLVPNGVFTQGIANTLYIVLTIAKAFYIVAYFMHLKFEKLGLIYCIIIPLMFIIAFIVAMLSEGGYTLLAR